MSELTHLDETNLEAGRLLPDTEALTTFWLNPRAVLDLVYGVDRQIEGAAPAHDHAQDGGESLSLPIIAHSFGVYVQNDYKMGIPLGIAAVSSFALVTTNGIEDRTGAKRLWCAVATLPGGCLGVRVNLAEWHALAGRVVQVTLAIRSLSSVNYKLGVAPEEQRADIAYTTVGAATWGDHSAELADLSSLGDPTLDREVEVSLWQTGDLTGTSEHRLLELSVIPRYFTTAARAATSNDLAFPQFSAKELKSGVGTFGAQLAAKVKEIFNSLNRGLWGGTPGLLLDLTPDLRRRYRESVGAAHQHLGVLVPDGSGGVFSDGAALKDTQALGFLTYLGETLPLVAGVAPTFDARPNQGAFLHFTNDLSVGWMRYQFRRSIPAGVGSLSFRFGAQPGFFYNAPSFDTTQKLLVSIAITPVLGGSDIVTRLFSGPYASPLDPSEVDFGYVEVEPVDDAAYLPNAVLLPAGKKGWNRGVERTEAERAAMQMNSVIYRVSEMVTAQLTYPPSRATEIAHETTDYDVKIRFKMINSAGSCDSEAGLLWLKCETSPGY